jgi:hypothetical protein
MRLRALISSSRSRLIISLSIVTLLLVGGAFAAQHHQIAPAQAASNGACGDPAVIADFAVVPILDPQALAQTVTIPANEPKVAAVVNGDQITAVELEGYVSIAYKSHQEALKHLSPDTPAVVRSELQKTPGQLRPDMLNKLIDGRLFMQEAQRLGISVSQAEARDEAQQQLQRFQSLPSSDPAHVTFQAYLCVNNLDTSTFLSNPLVLQGFQHALTMRAVNQHIIATLPQDQQGDQEAIRKAITAYTQNLRRSAYIQIFITLQPVGA